MRAGFEMMRWDMLLQLRSHLYSATLFTTLSLGLVAFLLQPYPIETKWYAVLLFTDPAIVGLSFVGAFMLMERGGRTLSALSVAPLTANTYLAGKVLSFSLLGVLSGLAIVLVVTRGHVNLLLAVFALALTNGVAVLIGFGLAAGVRSVNAFLVRMSVAMLVAVLPLLAFFDVGPAALHWCLAIIPSLSMLTLLEISLTTEGGFPSSLLWHSLYLFVWSGAGWIYAHHSYEPFVTSDAA